MSFAPLAGRLAARAAELRPVEGSRDNLAKFAALVMCALLDMLVLVCEMLDARAGAGVRPVAGQPNNRVSLDISRKSLSRARLARVANGFPAGVRQVVDNRAKPGHDGIRTLEMLVSRPIASSVPAPRGHGSHRAEPACLKRPSSQNAAFPAGFTHVQFITM